MERSSRGRFGNAVIFGPPDRRFPALMTSRAVGSNRGGTVLQSRASRSHGCIRSSSARQTGRRRYHAAAVRTCHDALVERARAVDATNRLRRIERRFLRLG